MNKFKEMFPLRIIKTVIAFLISLILAPYFYCDSFFAGLGSLRSMRESLTLSIYSLIEQVFANFLAFAIAVISSTLLGLNPYSVSLALFILFILIKKLDFYDSYLAAGVTLVAIMLLSKDQAELIDRAFDRFYSTLFGMLIALIVNGLLFKPKKIDDLTNVLDKLNEYVHIYMSHDLDEYAYLELHNTLVTLESERSIIEDELNSKLIAKKKKELLNVSLIEIDIVNAQCEAVFQLPYLHDDFRNSIIPVIIKLNSIKQYPSDKSEIPTIKETIKQMYNEHTTDDSFFVNTSFLSKLNDYINLLQEYEIIKS